MVGDVVGPESTAWLADRLPTLRHEHAIELVIVNAENCAVTAPTPWAGFRMTQVLVERLLKAGADVITSGNHGWDGPEGGTGFVADVGLTGPTGHPGGFPLAHFAASYRGVTGARCRR
jgi:calcineurin-like phosphoesterase